MKLQEKFEVFVGISTARLRVRVRTIKNENIEAVKVLTPKAIENCRINDDCLEESMIPKDLYEKVLTKEGDIVMKLSSPYEFCYIDKKHEGLLINSFLCRITPINEIQSNLSWYIMAFLASDLFNEQIVKDCAGSLTSIVRGSSIKNLEIPFDEKKAIEIGEKYKKIMEFKKTVDEIYKWELIKNSLEFVMEDD